MPETTSTLSNRVIVDRRFLLFQLDLSNTRRSVTEFDPGVQSKKKDFKFVDPLEYELPSDPLYWRNVLKVGVAKTAAGKDAAKDYKTLFVETLQKFQTELYTAIRNGISLIQAGVPQGPNSVTLRRDGVLPYTDLSNYVNKVSGYTNSVADFSNSIAITLSRPESSDPDDTVLSDLNISENDVIMVRASYAENAGDDATKDTYETEFLGFVSDADFSVNYGRISSYSLQVDGLSKFLSSTNVIKQRVLSSQYLAGQETTSTVKSPAMYEHEYQGKNTQQVMETLLKEVLGLVLPKGPFKETSNSFSNFVFDDSAFANLGLNAEDERTFQHALLVLLALYLMSITPATEKSQYYKTRDTPVLENPIRAVLEGGNHKTYNKMVTNGFELFFAQLQEPSGILSEVRTNTLYDVYETRQGQLVCRPPHYNKVELGNGLKESTAAIDWKDFFVVANGQAQFNPRADFYIDSYHYFNDVVEKNSDSEIETHTDVQDTWELVGVGGGTGWPGGNYSDPNLLVKYGLRAKGPINNPNVVSKDLAKLFAPIIQGMLNARTRGFSVRAADIKNYFPGKLYYLSPFNYGIPGTQINPGFMAYLDSASINHSYNTVSTVDLSFVLSRQVVDRKIVDIQASENECLNFAMMYLPLPIVDPQTDVTKVAVNERPRARLIERAKEELGKIRDLGASTIPMFKYVPSISDLVLEIENNPGSITPEPSQNTADNGSAAQRARQEVITDSSGSLYAAALSSGGQKLVKVRGSEVVAETPNTFDQGKSTQGIWWEPKKDEGFPTVVSAWKAHPGDVGGFVLDASVQKFFENPVGIAPYHLTESNPLYGKKELAYEPIRTPFTTTQVSTDGTLVFSQLLCNGLAQMDLWGKYGEETGSGSSRVRGPLSQRYIPNSDGSFSMYGLDFPADYADVHRADTLSPDPSCAESHVTLVEDPLAEVNTKFSGAWFEIPQGGTNMYRLPQGDLMVAKATNLPGQADTAIILHPKSSWDKTDTATYEIDALDTGVTMHQQFMQVTAGSYRITRDPANTLVYVITPLGESSLISPTGELIKKGKSFNILATSPLYFFSPYMEMSVERMMQLNIPAYISGYRTAAEAKTIREKLPNLSNSPYLQDNAWHQQGKAVKLCPQMVVASGLSDLRFKGGNSAETEATLSKVYSRIKALANKSLGNPQVKTHITEPVQNAVTLSPKYPDGSVAKKVYASVVTLYVTSEDEKAYLLAIRDYTTGHYLS